MRMILGVANRRIVLEFAKLLSRQYLWIYWSDDNVTTDIKLKYPKLKRVNDTTVSIT